MSNDNNEYSRANSGTQSQPGKSKRNRKSPNIIMNVKISA